MDHESRPLASTAPSSPATPGPVDAGATDPGRRDFLGTAFTLAGGAVVMLSGLDAAASGDAHHAPPPGGDSYNW
jgi:inactivated superfamily I helicase